MHYSDEREPKSSSKTHWSTSLDDFNAEPNGGQTHDDSREHTRVLRNGQLVRDGQAVGQDYKLQGE